jgi:hypothetical protein
MGGQVRRLPPGPDDTESDAQIATCDAMNLPRLDNATRIADQLNELAAMVKTRSRASLTDANRILETIATRFLNALFGWELVNLNTERPNYPAADLGDRGRRLAIQVTNEDGSDKIKRTAAKAGEHHLGTDFDRLVVFFLLPKKPRLPKDFVQPTDSPSIETWDIADLLKQLQDLPDFDALARAVKVLDEEMGKIPPPGTGPTFDISRILKYAPAELIGREDELKLLHEAWSGDTTPPTTDHRSQSTFRSRPHVLTIVALGGEGKTSLVAKWAAELAAQDWPGCDAVFAWSFYSQGTRESASGGAASSDLFLKEALTFFGDDADKAFAASPAGAFEKGQRLARLVGQRRSLLILDGLEPLQYAPTAPTPGELKDQGLAALLKGLAAASHGLCVVTTRYSLPDLKAFWPAPPSPSGRGAGGVGAAREVKLLRLSRDAGVHLLKTLGVNGTAKDFETLVEDVKGHALTLALLGGFLKRAFHGDIRQRDRVKFEKADEKMDGGHAFRTMAAYEQWLLRDGGDEGRREVAVLRLMGLFDRPADAGCLAALRFETIPGLTEPLAGLADDDWEFCLSGLETVKLLTVNRDAASALVSLDAHPLLREYFARQLRAQQPDAWSTAHRRIYEHLCASTKEGDEPTLESVELLCQAVDHGCKAGLQQEACDKVYVARIKRRDEDYAAKQLGAFGSDLRAIRSFFESPWSSISPSLEESTQAVLLNAAGTRLRALGRLTEGLEPMRAALEIRAKQEFWAETARCASNLSELELALGKIVEAIADAKRSVPYADKGDDFDRQRITRTAQADALHQAGCRAEAKVLFQTAESIIVQQYREFPLLYSVWGYRYCDLLLANAERSAWQATLGSLTETEPHLCSANALQDCTAVYERATQSLRRGEVYHHSLLGLALDHLMLALATLYEALLKASHSGICEARSKLELAVNSLRRAATTQHIPRGLLPRAWLRYLTGARTGPESAQADLDEAWEISERGPMKLFLADIHLYRARLFFREKPYPWTNPQADLTAAEKLINDCGYHRRDEELADAKRAIIRT